MHLSPWRRKFDDEGWVIPPTPLRTWAQAWAEYRASNKGDAGWSEYKLRTLLTHVRAYTGLLGAVLFAVLQVFGRGLMAAAIVGTAVAGALLPNDISTSWRVALGATISLAVGSLVERLRRYEPWRIPAYLLTVRYGWALPGWIQVGVAVRAGDERRAREVLASVGFTEFQRWRSDEDLSAEQGEPLQGRIYAMGIFPDSNGNQLAKEAMAASGLRFWFCAG